MPTSPWSQREWPLPYLVVWHCAIESAEQCGIITFQLPGTPHTLFMGTHRMFHGHLGPRCTAAYIFVPFREIGDNYTLVNAQGEANQCANDSAIVLST